MSSGTSEPPAHPPTRTERPQPARGDLADRIADVVTRCRRRIYAGVAVFVAIAAMLIVFGVHFASDVLDLLPRHFPSVQIFKIYDREFSQAREITFAVHDPTGDADLESFATHFAELLREQPWIVRVMDRSPLEASNGLSDVQALALPLLLNLPPAEFQAALAGLSPQKIEQRLAKLRAEMEAGSPKAEFQLEFDPLGIVAPALEPLAGSFSVEESRPLDSPDGTLRVILAVTDQESLSAEACQETMRKIEALKEQALATWDESPRPEILVTGRTPYVAELSLKMRADVLSTLATSAILVAAVFYLGFRRLWPLVAIVHVLLLCCVAAVGFGAVAFHELNMITIGLCSILIGLGVDFGMMLYSIYEAERNAGHSHRDAVAAALRHHARAVFFGAITTAAAFLTLLRSDCTGFEQLGVLIAAGIMFAGLFMMTLLFTFLPVKFVPRHVDPLRDIGRRFAHVVFRSPRLVFSVAAGAFLLLGVITLAPIGRLQFDANPRSLEPANSEAGRALRTITGKMPNLGEPILALVRADRPEEMHAQWQRLHENWAPLVAEGKLRSINTPAAFVISPGRTSNNAADISPETIATARAALLENLQNLGLATEAFAPTLGLLDALAEARTRDWSAPDWHNLLPDSSPWWFVLERFFGKDPRLVAGYLTPAAKITNFEEKQALERLVSVPGVDYELSGWTFTLADLIPWSKSKLVELTILMIVLNAVLLLVLCRNVFSLAVLFTALLLAMGALLATLKLFGVSLNLFNVLAFPLVLGVGVDYGIYVVLAMREPGNAERAVAGIIKPVLLSGMTTVVGFGSLALAQNPALRGLGMVCSIGVAWCIVATFFFSLPLYIWRWRR